MRTVEATVHINSTTQRALDAFTDPELLRGWWGVERALVEKHVGGVYTLAWNISKSGFGYVASGIVRSYEAGKILEIGAFVYLNPERPILGPMTFRVLVENANPGAVVHLTQGGYQDSPDWDWYYDAVKQAWPDVLVQLKNYLEST